MSSASMRFEIRRRNLESAAPTFPIRRPAAALMIPAIRRRCLEKLLAWRIYPELRKQQTELRGKAFLWASAGLLHRQSRHRAERQSRHARRTARRLGERDRARAFRRQVTVLSGSHSHARVTTSPLRRSPPTGSSSISTTSVWSRANRSHSIRQRTWGALRCRSPAPRSTGRRTASSPRPGRSPPRRWNARSRTIVH